jgi:hypothetical protein
VLVAERSKWEQLTDAMASVLGGCARTTRELRVFRRQRERDLDEEIESHLRMAAADRMVDGACGMRRASGATEFGNVALVKDVTRDMWAGRWFDRLLQDLRVHAAAVCRSPWVVTALATLALGIGATTTVFTIVDRVQFRPPPYLDGDSLVQVMGLEGLHGAGGNILNAHLIRGWQAQGVFDRFEGFGPQQFDVTGDDGEPERAFGYAVTTGLFSMLGTAPELGRCSAPATVAPGRTCRHLGHGLWLRRLAAPRDARAPRSPQRRAASHHRYHAEALSGRDDEILLPMDLASHDGDSTVGNLVGLGRLPRA